MPSKSLSFFRLPAALVFVAAAFVFVYPAPAAWAKENPKYASLILDADTGQILSQRYADKKVHPASLTKVMTLLLVFDALGQGKISLEDRVRISPHAASMEPSKLGLPVGSTIRVKDAIYAVVTKSANDIAAALAEHLGGTEDRFARMMTLRARQLGMNDTIFTNASGLHDVRQITTARDMAKMARTVINDYPAYYPYFSTKNFKYGGRSYHNHNRLMSSYRGMDGLKTGYVEASGFNLIASAVRDNRRLIGVVFGGRSAASRNAHMASLLDNGFASMGDVRIASADASTAKDAPVPPRKPGILVALASLNKVEPATGMDEERPSPQSEQRLAYAEQAALNSGRFGEMMGEGDYDPAGFRRMETGLMAIAALKGEDFRNAAPQKKTEAPPAKVINAAFKQPSTYSGGKSWAVQVGAFTSRAATDQVLAKAQKNLPAELSGNPMIAPLRTNEGWLFRARLGGYTREQAFNACRHLKDCLPVAPQN